MIDSISDTIFSALVAFGVTGLAIDAVVGIAPKPNTQNAFEVRSITAERVDDTAILDVDRIVYMPIEMGYVVRVLEKTSQGYRQFCKMEGPPLEYQTDAVLPDPVTLSWWTDGECAMLPDGPARISTTWTPVKDGYDAVTYNLEIPAKGAKE